MESKEIGYPIKLEDLEVNDLFYMDFGWSTLKWRVHVKLQGDVIAHSIDWCKDNGIRIKPELRDGRDMFYAGKISKLRAFFML